MDETDWDELFGALADVHRRRLLLALLAHNPQRETVQVPEDVYEGERRLGDLQIEMVHRHLPMLAEAGFVDWDRESHEVLKGPAFDDVEPFLELLDEHHTDLFPGLV